MCQQREGKLSRSNFRVALNVSAPSPTGEIRLKGTLCVCVCVLHRSPRAECVEKRTLFFANFLALLSLLFLSSSITRLSYGARPATSLMISRTNAVRFDRWPLLREMRAFCSIGVVFYRWTKAPKKGKRWSAKLQVLVLSAKLLSTEGEVTGCARERARSGVDEGYFRCEIECRRQSSHFNNRCEIWTLSLYDQFSMRRPLGCR